MSKFNQKQAKWNFVIQIYYPKGKKSLLKFTIIISEYCSLSPCIMFAHSWNMYKWNYTEYNILCLASFTIHNVFEIHPWIYYAIHIFCFWALFVCVNMLYFVSLLFSSWNEHSCINLFWAHMFLFLLENYPKMKFLGDNDVHWIYKRFKNSFFKLLYTFILSLAKNMTSHISTLSPKFDAISL